MGIVTRLSNNESVNLSDLSIEELYKLGFVEESFAASEAQNLSPFSIERNQLLNSGYKLNSEIAQEIAIKKTGSMQPSYGASQMSIKPLIKLVLKKLNQNKSQQTVLYEAGVGVGYTIKNIVESFSTPELQIKGCDINLGENAIALTKKYPNIDLQQGHIFDCIKNLPDNSIDIFYADNVLEHLLPDEAEIIYSEIAKKLKPGAYIYVIIPNRFTGPHDISRRFLEMGEKARGTHFMEMSFNEVTNYMSKYKIYHLYCVFLIPRYRIFYVKSRFFLKIKLKLEYVFSKIPNKFIKRILFSSGGYSWSIMSKEDTIIPFDKFS